MLWTTQLRERIYSFYDSIYDIRFEILTVIAVIIIVMLGLYIYTQLIGSIKDKKISTDTNDWWSWEKYYEKKNEEKKK